MQELANTKARRAGVSQYKCEVSTLTCSLISSNTEERSLSGCYDLVIDKML